MSNIFDDMCVYYSAGDWEIPLAVGDEISWEALGYWSDFATALVKQRWTHTVQFLWGWSFSNAFLFFPLPIYAGYACRLAVDGSFAVLSPAYKTCITRVTSSGTYSHDTTATASTFDPYYDPNPPVTMTAASAGQYVANSSNLIAGYSVTTLTATSPGGFTFRPANGTLDSSCYCRRPDGTTTMFPKLSTSPYLPAAYLRLLDSCRQTSEQMPIVICSLPALVSGSMLYNNNNYTAWPTSYVEINCAKWIPLHQTMAKRSVWITANANTTEPGLVYAHVWIGGQYIKCTSDNFTLRSGYWYQWIVPLTPEAFNDARMDYGVAGIVPVKMQAETLTIYQSFAMWIAGSTTQ